MVCLSKIKGRKERKRVRREGKVVWLRYTQGGCLWTGVCSTALFVGESDPVCLRWLTPVTPKLRFLYISQLYPLWQTDPINLSKRTSVWKLIHRCLWVICMCACVCNVHVRQEEVQEGKTCSSDRMNEAGMRFLVRLLMQPNFDWKCVVSEDPISLT